MDTRMTDGLWAWVLPAVSLLWPPGQILYKVFPALLPRLHGGPFLRLGQGAVPAGKGAPSWPGAGAGDWPRSRRHTQNMSQAEVTRRGPLDTVQAAGPGP